MGDNKLSNERLIRNEQILRDKNTNAEKALKQYFHNDKDVQNAPMEFICECSTLNCKKHVNISISTYEKIHARRDRFVISKGHETPQVEKVVQHEPDFDIVEKPALSA